MTTLKPRINITVPGEIAGILSKTAKRNKKSVSKVALELIEWAIEEREDIYFSRIADERMRGPKWVKDNENIWK
jgi:predicted DNA-binding protein